MSDPDEKIDAKLMQMFGDDPAAAVMSQEKVSTKVPFSLDAPPVVKNNIPTNPVMQDITEMEPSPFIQEPSQSIVQEDGSIDWSEESENLVEVFDIIQAAGFKFLAKATEEEKETLFAFSAKDKARLAKFTKPIAQKHNIRVPREISLITALAEIMARNASVAMDMRNKKEAEKAEALAAASEKQSKITKLQVVKSEESKP